MKGRRTLYVSAFYRPDVSDENSLSELETSLQRVTQLKNAYIIMGGDFNLPGWDWSLMSTKEKCPYPQFHHKFMDIISDNGLEQVVKETTRGNNTLDLILTNCPDLVPRVEVIPGLSDHDIPYCEFSMSTAKRSQPQRQIPLYAKADWASLRETAKGISISLNNMKDASTTELWTFLKQSLLAAVKNHVPVKSTRKRAGLPWITSTIRKMTTKKNRMFRKLKKNGNPELKSELQTLKKTIQRQTRQSYWKYLIIIIIIIIIIYLYCP